MLGVPSITDEGEITFASVIDRFDTSGDDAAVTLDLSIDQKGDSVRSADGVDSEPEFAHPPFPPVAFMRASRMSVMSKALEA